MRTELVLNNNSDPTSHYLTWSPIPAQISLADVAGAIAPVEVLLKNRNPTRGGQVLFYSTIPAEAQPELRLILPLDGSSVGFFVGGQFGRPSLADKDTVIEVVEVASGSILSHTALMVRIRKNADTLTVAERKRFISALMTLNQNEHGVFSDFLAMHTQMADRDIHSGGAFLPWHRAYLLDLERELQRIDASVTQPYWRFDQPSSRVFIRGFMGISDDTGNVSFFASNLLTFWRTNNGAQIDRRSTFSRKAALPGVDTEEQTLAFADPEHTFSKFLWIQYFAHNDAHNSFTGDLASLATAPRDPLFFMLHANIDRLWAKWQLLNRRFDPSDVATYPFQKKIGEEGSEGVGHNLEDTLWPWNQDKLAPRPNFAPGGTFAHSPLTAAPGDTPRVRDMFDYQGVLAPESRLGFDYDDVPFSFRADIPTPRGPTSFSISSYRDEMDKRIQRSIANRANFSDFLDKSRPTISRREVLTTGARPRNQEEVEQSITLISDRSEPVELRSAALRLLSPFLIENPTLFDLALAMLNDPNEAIEMRRESLTFLERSALIPAIFEPRQPQFLASLRALTDDPDETIRERAIERLSFMKDSAMIGRVSASLQARGAPLIDPARAIRLLGNDIHADDFSILHQIILNPPSQPAKRQAVRRLANDPSATSLLSTLFRDKSESPTIRQESAIALQTLSPGIFQNLAKEMIADPNENEALQSLCISALDHLTASGSLTADPLLVERIKWLRKNALSRMLRRASADYLSRHG